ncbi:FMN-binding negative transcriptional regulator [Vogesella sp. LIG4]|uniref:FMN-binding negative transcriptional regulator n=1 Tax=Vogesella sp. LIG4 TaxID=1192162 RepID=UPI00081F8014|nr:FMN-binding negative transcriptional regulator [Vogesella sp. LIG4]SCK13360.1 negative transcriptional regulator, PaiB family [Vogesella sp. LIG4]
MPFYQPPSFVAAANVGRTLASEFPFATLITQHEGTPWISHLVLLPDPADPDCLLGHLAAANGHSQAVLQAPSVAIFHGEHDYISPRWYSSPNMVPTWNYRVAHAHGQASVVDGAGLSVLLQLLAARFEGADGWSMDAVPEKALTAMQRAIVGFRLRVARWEVKEKLSQNRTPQDVAGAVEALQAGSPQQQQLAARMLAVAAR